MADNPLADNPFFKKKLPVNQPDPEQAKALADAAPVQLKPTEEAAAEAAPQEDQKQEDPKPKAPAKKAPAKKAPAKKAPAKKAPAKKRPANKKAPAKKTLGEKLADTVGKKEDPKQEEPEEGKGPMPDAAELDIMGKKPIQIYVSAEFKAILDHLKKTEERPYTFLIRRHMDLQALLEKAAETGYYAKAEETEEAAE